MVKLEKDGEKLYGIVTKEADHKYTSFYSGLDEKFTFARKFINGNKFEVLDDVVVEQGKNDKTKRVFIISKNDGKINEVTLEIMRERLADLGDDEFLQTYIFPDPIIDIKPVSKKK